MGQETTNLDTQLTIRDAGKDEFAFCSKLMFWPSKCCRLLLDAFSVGNVLAPLRFFGSGLRLNTGASMIVK